MKWWNTFRSLPVAVLGLLMVFAVVPFCSLAFLSGPQELLIQGRHLALATWFATYWFLPLLICFALLKKHHWFLPLYIAQCVGLTLHAVLTPHASDSILFARILLIGLMIYVGFLFGSRSFLYPLLTKEYRLWRRSIRYRIGREASVARGDQVTPALLQDASGTGMQLTVALADLPYPTIWEVDGQMTVLLRGEDPKREYRLCCTLVWSQSEGRSQRLGLKAQDPRAMKEYLNREFLKKELPVRLPQLRSFSLEQDIQETALVLWLACIALSFALPAFAL